jgi:hypothetical protein
MTRKVYGALGVIALAATLRIASASAGPCAGKSPISGTPFRKTKTVNHLHRHGSAINRRAT